MIQDETHYRAVMARIDELFDEDLTPEQAAELNRLVGQVEEYEQDVLGDWEDPT
ncbi:MAG: hypothetical protein ACRC16_21975 [Aeromonas salmonicida]